MCGNETVTETPPEVARSATSFNGAWAQFQGAAMMFERDAEKKHEADTADQAETARKAAAVARTRAANAITQELLRLRDAIDSLGSANALAESVPEPLDSLGSLEAARAVRVATLQLPAVQELVRDASIPVVVELLDRGNVVIQGAWEEHVADTLREVVVRAVAGTAAGQLIVVSIDPSLRTPLAFLERIRLADDGLLPTPAADPRTIQATLESLRDQVQAVRARSSGAATSLGEYRSHHGQPIGAYQLIVVTDFPAGFDDSCRALLVDLMREGPSVGISFLVQTESNVTLDARAAAHTTTIQVRHGTLECSSLPGHALKPVTTTNKQIERITAEVAEAAKDAASPQVPFASIQAYEGAPCESSASGITATLGLGGAVPLEIRLGDRSSQLHNVLVAGAVGQGKSKLLMVMVHSLAMRYPPDELQMYLLDFKDGVTLFPLSGSDGSDTWLPQAALLGLASDRSFGSAVLKDLTMEFERRAAVIRPYGDSIQAYREEVPDATMPRLLVIIDEFQVLFEEDDAAADEALANIEKIARKGRAYGIHLVLASQTLSGITKLLAKQDGIFSQFPIRISLRNSASESRAVLDPANDAASRLRPREVIVNADFGAPTGNVQGVVAHTDPDDLKQLRGRLVQADHRRHRPVIFNGEVPARVTEHNDFLRRLRKQARESGRTGRVALIGLPMGLSLDPTGIVLSPESGRNVAIIGAAASQTTILRDGANADPALPIGVLQGMALSLGLQHPDADAHFVFLDFLPETETPRAAATARMLQLLGLTVEHLRGPEAASWLANVSTQPAGAGVSTGSVYVLGWAMDRIMGMSDGLNSPRDGLAALVQQGPQHGHHFIGWWATYKAFSDQAITTYPPIDAAFQAIVALRISRNDVKDLFGPFQTWIPERNRGLLIDSISEDLSGVVVPFAPLEPSDITRLTREDWD